MDEPADSTRILLVEDDPVDAEIFRRSVRGSGFEITVAESLAGAQARLGQERFDLILLDLFLPDSDGTHTFEEAMRSAGERPIVVMTGLGDRNLGTRFVRMGAMDYLVKGELSGSALARALHYSITRHGVEKELREARSAAQAAARAKSDFLSSMSHEIRTPLNAILGMADLLAERELDEEQTHFVQVFKRAGETLLHVINGILDLSQAESGKLELDRRPFQLTDTLEAALDILAFSAHKKGLVLLSDLRPGTPTRLVGDAARLGQVLINLIGNAVKFTEEGEVVLRVEPAPDAAQAGELLFSVSDTGVGIAASERERIFGRYARADSSAPRNPGGTGLGLSVAGALVERMGGRLWLESEPEVGSTFRFTARFELDAEGDSAPEWESSAGAPALVATTNATERRILRERLARGGFQVSEASQDSEALGQARQASHSGHPFELALVDCRLPEHGGLEVARSLLAEDRLRRVILLLNADHRPGDTARIGALERCYWLLKPVKSAELDRALWDPAEGSGPRCRAPEPDESRGAELRPLRILLCEDSEDNRALVLAYLRSTPYHVVLASDGREAIEKFKSERFDLVLMDMQMPIVDGYGATRSIRSWERQRKSTPTPILALTAYAFPDEAQRSREVGCDAHLTKPIAKKALLDAIAAHGSSPGPEAEPGPEPKVEVDEELRDLVPGFLENRWRDVARLKRAIAEGDRETIRRLGHNMKGSGAGYGFEAISRLGAELEAAARGGNLLRAQPSLARLESFLEHVEVGGPEGGGGGADGKSSGSPSAE